MPLGHILTIHFKKLLWEIEKTDKKVYNFFIFL